MIRQSLGFFQNDYAGRIANRIMQTGGSLRQSTVQIVDAIWYVVVYTGSAAALFAHADAGQTVFRSVLDAFFDGEEDPGTLERL